MNAVLAQPDRFATFARADLSEPEKLRRVNVTVRLIARYRQSGKAAVSFRCTICGGRVDVESQRDGTTTGRCRTTNCLSWEE